MATVAVIYVVMDTAAEPQKGSISNQASAGMWGVVPGLPRGSKTTRWLGANTSWSISPLNSPSNARPVASP